jgi:hypothetical protein
MFNATAPTLAGNPPRPATVNVTLPFAGTAVAVGTPIANRVSSNRAGATPPNAPATVGAPVTK